MPKIEYIARALLQREDSFLLCRDIRYAHAYLPGGHVEFGESAADAALRELKEEAGLAGVVTAPLLFWEARFTQHGKPKHEVTLVFHVEPPEGHEWPGEVMSQEDHIQFEWIPHRDAHLKGIVPRQAALWLAAKPAPGVSLKWLSINELG